ncbi:MAG TPA: hypothetical protein VKI41_16860 [Vicinamibacteria bacterium]|nr:hypothetical protein [Vicinamibacteria bacterium]
MDPGRRPGPARLEGATQPPVRINDLEELQDRAHRNKVAEARGQRRLQEGGR